LLRPSFSLEHATNLPGPAKKRALISKLEDHPYRDGERIFLSRKRKDREGRDAEKMGLRAWATAVSFIKIIGEGNNFARALPSKKCAEEEKDLSGRR